MNLEAEFAAGYPFPLDGFQKDAIRALSAGRSVLVCAPTGAGKTVVGEFAVWSALNRGGKAFYTTPIKALSNQKFGDFIARHSAARVGLLTGDNSINGEAPLVVMTTEVLRNMLYESSPTLDGLDVVVLDEVHYLKDPYRGAVWEEVLIHLPARVAVAALSATVSNAAEFGEWLATVRGATDVVVEERRPVPLDHLYLSSSDLSPVFVRRDGSLVANPVLRRRRSRPDRPDGPQRGRFGRQRHRRARPDRVHIVELLSERRMIPSIVFVFSRAGCDQAVRQCVAGGLRLTNASERERIREYTSMRAGILDDADLSALGYEDWLDGLERGIAAHHAGLIPLFKETVEELFERALVKVVFATETLSLGINMPAKTVVIERPIKFTGEHHEFLTPGDYTQLTGRAGRRGIDDAGFGVVVHHDDVPFERVAALAGATTYPLTSSFRPSYNMAVNLVRRVSVEEASRLLTLSFAQFLADRGVVSLTRRLERNETFRDSYRERAACERGDYFEYRALARRLEQVRRDRATEARRETAERRRAAVAALRPGEVVTVRQGGRRRRAAVIEVLERRDGQIRALLLADDRRFARLSPRDFGAAGPQVLGTIRLPAGDPRAPSYRHAVGERLAAFPETPVPSAGEPHEAPAAPDVEAHPCHLCPDRADHERWASRLETLEAETARLRRRVESRTATLARTFERVLRVLDSFGYLKGEELTGKGGRLCRLYSEADLLISETVEAGILGRLDGAELCSATSFFVFEAREPFASEPTFPTDAVQKAHAAVRRIWRRISEAERAHGLSLCREPDAGFAEQVYWWARGESLEEVLEMGRLAPGDFVRATKQVWDLLRQLEDVVEDEGLRGRCKEAAAALYRGVVAASGAL